jgi:hypothetical protein
MGVATIRRVYHKLSALTTPGIPANAVTLNDGTTVVTLNDGTTVVTLN